MINGLLMAKGVIALTTFVTAAIAWLTMMQMRKKIPAIFKADARTLRQWHVVSGRISLATFILLAFVGMGLAFYLYQPATLRAWIHVVVSIATTFVFVAKVVVVRRKMQPWFRQLLPFGIVLMILHLIIFLSATVWAYYFKITGAL